MSQLEVDKIIPQSGTTLTLGDTGDTINFGSGVLPNFENLTVTGDLTVDTNSLYVDSTNNYVGIGTASPDGNLHIMSDSAGTVTAASTANDLVIEGTGATGISILTPNDQNANILFGDPDDAAAGLIQYRHSDDSLRFYLNGTSEKMQIDSSGNVGIGTSSPQRPLHVTDGNSQAFIRVQDTANNADTNAHVGGFEIYGADGNRSALFRFESSTNRNLNFGNETSTGSLIFETNATEAMRIDSSGKVFIGTTSTNLGLDAVSTGYYLRDGGQFRVARTGSQSIIANRIGSDGAILDLRKDGDTVGQLSAQSGGMGFNVGSVPSEAMRIDSSGTVLVGKTSSNIATAGVELLSDRIYSTRDGSIPLYLNRLTSDGAIAEFRKDNATVGSIFSSGSIQCGIGDGSTAFLFADNISAILPWQTNNTSRDAGIDLGRTTTRWKNLYLSGSVYLGGTTSANALDDYETGTWTPIYVPSSGSFSSVTYDPEVRGFYTKIGKLVVAQGFIMTDAISVGTASGDVFIGGLPFTVKIEDNQVDTGAGVIGNSADFGGDNPSSAYPTRNTTTAYLFYRTTSNGVSLTLDVSDLGTGTNDNQMRFSIIYRAD